MPADTPKAPGAIDNLISILDLEPLEQNLFRGRSPQQGWQRVFGGQVSTIPPSRHFGGSLRWNQRSAGGSR